MTLQQSQERGRCQSQNEMFSSPSVPREQEGKGKSETVQRHHAHHTTYKFAGASALQGEMVMTGKDEPPSVLNPNTNKPNLPLLVTDTGIESSKLQSKV